jgi:tetratricopeptide (TPR) repeat protein
MALRFRKSIKIAPGIKLNVSKSGLGISAGVRGARVGVNSRGSYTSVGIPGTGISSMSYHSSGNSGKTASIKQGPSENSIHHSIRTKTNLHPLWMLFILLALFVINPFLGLIALCLSLVGYYYLKRQPLFQAKQLLGKAKLMYKNGDYSKAAGGFEQSYLNFPNDKAIALHAASAYSQLGQFEKSVHFSEEYLTMYPEDTGIQKQLARWLVETGSKDKALQILQSLGVEDTKDTSILLLMANILSEKNLNDAAIDVLKRAPITKRSLSPDLVEIIYTLGLLYEKTGDKKRSRNAFERVYSYDASFKDVAEHLK